MFKEFFNNNVYTKELSDVLESIDSAKINDNYSELVKQSLDRDLVKKVKFNNDILHRSKVIRHFLESYLLQNTPYTLTRNLTTALFFGVSTKMGFPKFG